MRKLAFMVILASLAAPSAALANTYAVIQVTEQWDNTCTDGVVFPSRIGQITETETVPTHPAADSWFQMPNGVWNAVSEIYNSWGDDTHQFIWKATTEFPGSLADLSCSGELSHDQLAATTFAGVGVGDYFDVPIPPVGSYTDNFGPLGTTFTMIPAGAAYNGYLLDAGSYISFATTTARIAVAPITLYSVHSRDRNIRVSKNGRLVKRGPALLALNARWAWTPKRHGTYHVKWTSRGVRHSRTVIR